VTSPATLAWIPDTGLDVRYRMGPLFTADANDFWWNLRDTDGVITVCTEPDGWESVDYILPLDQVGGKDGAHTGPQSVGPRTLECSATIVAPNAQLLRSRLQWLRRLLGPQGVSGTRQPVIWEQHDWASGLRLALVTRPSGLFRSTVYQGNSVGGNAAQVSFTLIATTPVKYQSGLVQAQETGLLNPGAASGRTYDKTYNYTYGPGGNPGGSMVVVNSGDSLAWPTYYVTGPADFPIIGNATTGRDFQLVYSPVAGETITINSSTGEITPGTVRLYGRPFALVPGPNTITFRTQSGAYDSNARLRLEWRSTFS
jgi:hypothetical protein